ncbi:MAG: DUF1573 domain-containing protein [Bacteroidetes bacterium]|nr:MAG: DUF1573 domain-containing protein [Bacteroidota bacterium]
MFKTSHLHIILFFYCVIFISCGKSAGGGGNYEDSERNTTAFGPEIKFDKELHDFGKIISGERVVYGFRFTNTGSSPLIITGIRSGCGCTVADYPKEPLMPGDDGRIQIVFNSSGRRGFQSESVRVLTNAKESIVTLRITAEVLER